MEWIYKHRFLVIFLSLLFVGFSSAGALYLKETSDYRIYFDETDPLLKNLEALEEMYIKEDNALIVVAPNDGKLFTKETLSVIKMLTDESWKVPYSVRVDSITNFQHSHAQGDDIVVADLVENPENLSESDLEKLRTIAVNEPLLVKKLISPQAHVTGIKITVKFPTGTDSDELRPDVVSHIRELARKTESAHSNIKIYLTSNIFMNDAFPEASRKDMETLIPAMFILIGIMLFILLKKWPSTVTTILIILFSITSTMGIAGWLGIKLSPAVSAAPLIILTLSVADSVHILLSYHYFYAHDKLDQQKAISESIRINLQPVFLTSFTTAIGFLSMNSSDSPPFRDLGNVTAIGVAIAYILTMILLPALMVAFPARVPESKESKHEWIMKLAQSIVRYPKQYLWSMVALIIIPTLFIPNNQLDEQFSKYFDKSLPFRQATDFTSENLTGVDYIDYSLSSGKPNGINDPQFLQKVEDFANWYRQQPEVSHVSSLTDIIKRLNKNMHNDDSAWYRLPEDRELTAQYLLFYEMSLPFGLDLNDRINVDKSATRLSVTLNDISTENQLDLEERAQEWLKNNTPAMQTEGVGRTIMFAHIARNNIISMLKGTLLAIFLISLTIVFAFRSIKIGILSLICNVPPASMAFGMWGIVSGHVGMAAAVIVSISLGIVVDDTIHFMSKYFRVRQEKKLTPKEAVLYAFDSVGMAMITTSIVLLAGFLLLSLSNFQVNSTMGLLVSITIALALILDLLFLPALLIEIEERKPIVLSSE